MLAFCIDTFLGEELVEGHRRGDGALVLKREVGELLLQVLAA